MPPKKRSDEREKTVDSARLLADIFDVDGDIGAMAFIVMMEAVKSAREDLKSIMAGVKAINAAKQNLRELLAKINRDAAAAAVADFEGRVVGFSPNGLGGEDAYQRVKIAIPDPDVPGGVQFAVVSLVDGKVTSRHELEAARDAVRDKLDSMSELSEMESLRLQMAMDRLSKLMSTLSNIMKKTAEVGLAITQNIK
jgi:hypothetical protein